MENHFLTVMKQKALGIGWHLPHIVLRLLVLGLLEVQLIQSHLVNNFE